MIRELFGEYEEERYEIWQECFGDSREYIQRFFAQTRQCARVIGCIENGELLSVAYLLPAEYAKKGKKRVGMYYLYAGATREQYRGKGYFAKLLQWLFENVQVAVFLVPASEELITYYEKQGMRRVLEKQELFYQGKNVVKKQSETECTIQSVAVEEYLKKRDERWLTEGYVRWDERMLQYILQENVFCGGFCGKIVLDNQEIFMMARKNQKQLEIFELLNEKNMEEILELACQLTGCEQATVCRQPDVCVWPGNSVYCDMNYFNLTLG